MSTGPLMHSYDLAEFLKLSAALNYQLVALHINWDGIKSILLDERHLPKQKLNTFEFTIRYLHKVYGNKSRRLGSLALLHPLRVTTFLSRFSKNPTLVDYLSALLHDVYEDINPDLVDDVNWIHPDDKFKEILDLLPKSEQWYLMERLGWLTKKEDETYYHYIGRFLENAQNTPEVVRVKLSDRLDNTLDLRIDIYDPLDKINFFEVVFQILYNKAYTGYKPKLQHSSITAINGAERLYQLFKNIVLLSLIRQNANLKNDSTSKKIFKYLAIASMKEAQRIALHIFAYHEKDVRKCRNLLIETMSYVTSGGIESVTAPKQGYRLDGLLVSRFDDPNKIDLRKKLEILYSDKPLMIEASMAFIVIFLSFLTNKDYFVQGISRTGVKPATKQCPL
jgi:hypothetical protein